ncbi:MAG: methyltransferase, partial [Promethearchaeota archaeon]
DEISSNSFLILGNPPWVTNSALEKLNSVNLPTKSNYRKLSGMDSMTGKSNFDIAESIILKLFKSFGQYHGHFAMLCKPIIVRNILKDKSNQRLKISNLQSFQIDSKKFFKVNAPACLFCADLGDKGENFCETGIFEDELTFNNSHNNQSEETKTKKFGWKNGKFVADIELYREFEKFDGKCPFVWRQGVKHDLSKIMVLSPYCKGNIGKYTNGLKKEISLENEIIYPFLKSSDLQKPISQKARHSIIITQRKIGESTDYIKIKYPLIWKYLHQYRLNFDQRKSRIYRNQPHFALFGIGPYAFAPYKVAISGFYKNGNFMLIEPESAKPVMTDDTSYFIPFQKRSNAIFIWLILNLPEIKTLLSSIIFPTAKRPYTKEVLMRLDLQAIVADYSYIKFQNIFQSDPYLEYAKDITEKEFLNLKNQFFVS